MPLPRIVRWLYRKKTVLYASLSALLIALLVIGSNYWIVHSTAAQLYSQVNQIPSGKVGLVLGASPTTRFGTTNLYFRYRMEAAAQLYKAGKINHLLLSGDNHQKGYDEPSEMKKYLIRLGVPAAAITLDYAGFRTLESVVRAKEVFGQTQLTIISQAFHNQRAVYLARQKGIKAIGFNARDVSGRYSLKTRFREVLAKFKAVLDVWVLRTQPRFLGESVALPS